MSSLLLLAFLLLVNYVAALPLAGNSISISNIKRSVSGPAIIPNFPDPCVIKVGSTWYAFATRNKGTTTPKIQVASSQDFNNWTISTNANGTAMDALPTLPAWVDTSSAHSFNTWAPDVSQLDDGTFVMYYAATAAASTSGKHCVGAATSANVTGPYIPQAAAMFCNLTVGGAIDPAGFRDHNGQRYVVYKVDGNSIGHVSEPRNAICLLHKLTLSRAEPAETPSHQLSQPHSRCNP